MFEVMIIANFEAAHYLPDYPGKCSRLHGHNYRVEVTVKGSELNTLGMLVDFRDLKQEVNEVISLLDHYCLNDLEPFRNLNPTAENIARFIYVELSKSGYFNSEIGIKSVRVWESPGSAAIYYQSES